MAPSTATVPTMVETHAERLSKAAHHVRALEAQLEDARLHRDELLAEGRLELGLPWQRLGAIAGLDYTRVIRIVGR